MKYLLFSGSLKTESLNRKLISVVAKQLQEKSENKVTILDLRLLEIPLYDGDLEVKGMPEGVKKLGALISENQALIISSPEYNSSIAGTLKNAIDWVSRLRPIPFDSKPVLLMGATPGGFGAIRGMAATRVPLEALGSYVYPQTFGLAKAHEAISGETQQLDPINMKKLNELLVKFENFSKKIEA